MQKFSKMYLKVTSCILKFSMTTNTAFVLFKTFHFNVVSKFNLVVKFEIFLPYITEKLLKINKSCFNIYTTKIDYIFEKLI